MKIRVRPILSVLLLAGGFSSAVVAQTVVVDLTGNLGGVGAASGGLRFQDTGSGPLLLNVEPVNLQLWGGIKTNGVTGATNQLASLTGTAAFWLLVPG